MHHYIRTAAIAVASLLFAAGGQAESLNVIGFSPVEGPVSSTADPFDLAAQHQALAKAAYQPVIRIDPPESPVPEPSSSEKTLSRSLPDLVSDYMHLAPEDAEHECLAGAVYFEAKGEPLEGQLAVADVVLNRARSGKYPPTICGVVTQKSQFSFVRRGRIPPISRNSDAWRRAVAVAQIAQEELADGGVGSAMFFHARYVAPNWRRLTRVASIGNHIFYK